MSFPFGKPNSCKFSSHPEHVSLGLEAADLTRLFWPGVHRCEVLNVKQNSVEVIAKVSSPVQVLSFCFQVFLTLALCKAWCSDNSDAFSRTRIQMGTSMWARRPGYHSRWSACHFVLSIQAPVRCMGAHIAACPTLRVRVKLTFNPQFLTNYCVLQVL